MSDIRTVRIARMLDDPDLTGDLLLLGVAFARFLDYGGIPLGEKLNTKHVAGAVFGSGQMGQRRVKGALADDARSYQRPSLTWQDRVCGAPMIRRDGTCGQRSAWERVVTNWATGEESWLLACRRHVPWYDEQARENREAKPDRLVLPAANHGGLLARHIPEFGWPKIWHWATNGRWVELPEVIPRRPPTFTLHLGDGEASLAAARPTLVPVEAS